MRQSSLTVNKDACNLNVCAPRDRWSSVRQRRHWCCALWYACWCTRLSTFTCDAVVLIHFVLTALIPQPLFSCRISVAIFCIWKCSVYSFHLYWRTVADMCCPFRQTATSAAYDILGVTAGCGRSSAAQTNGR